MALAQRVQELSRYRSDFFGRLREILAGRSDIEVVGDRFVLPASVLFPSASDEINASFARRARQARRRHPASSRGEIPPEIAWVIRVDGHTDKRPIPARAASASNWELSAARAIAVVRYLIDAGRQARAPGRRRLRRVPAARGGRQRGGPARNRRIELKLTER